jgi:hypothetical protein
MNDLKKTKKELAAELEELREKVKSYESQDSKESGFLGNDYSFSEKALKFSSRNATAGLIPYSEIRS